MNLDEITGDEMLSDGVETISIADIDFIIETLETAIEWAEYADDYFKEKHNLNKDKRMVDKAIKILKDLR